MLTCIRRENEALAGHDEALRFIEAQVIPIRSISCRDFCLDERQFSRVPEYLAKLKRIQSTMATLQSTSTDMKSRVKQVHEKCIENALAKTLEVTLPLRFLRDP